MKRFPLLGIIALIGALLCATTASAQQRSIDDVLSIVEKATARTGAAQVFKSKSYGENINTLRPSSHIIEQLGGSKRDALDNGTEAFYVYAPEGNSGFVVVSADERMSPVLAYASEGSFAPDSMPDNVKAWMLSYIAEARQLSQTLGATLPRPAQPIVGTESGEVGPLLTTEWDQTYPYNALCPNYSGTKRAVTGCVATAMAQIMNFYKYPTTGKGSRSYTSASYNINLSRDFSQTTFRWDLLKNKYSAYGNTDDEVNAIADLMLTCGISVGMDYGPESGSAINYAIEALNKYFSYDQDMCLIERNVMSLDRWHQTLIAELDARRPILFSGTSPSGYGHAFIIDGYTPDGDDYPYYHVNWGWGGAYNADFKMTHLGESNDPNEAYTLNMKAVTGFKPEDNVQDIANYMSLNAITVESNNIDLTKNGRLVFSIDRIQNFSLRPFTGTISICLADEKGGETPIYSFTTSNVNTAYYMTLNSVHAAAANSLQSGQYTFKAYAINQDDAQRMPIEIAQDPGPITITNSSDIFHTDMQAVVINVSTSGRNVSLDATGVCNLSESAFSGTLKMMLTDYYDNYLTTIGNSTSFSDVPQYSYYGITFNFNGSLPLSITDGAYRLYLGANQTGYSNWDPVRKYEIKNNFIGTHDLYGGTKFWVKDNVITLTPPFTLGDINTDYSLNIADLSALVRLVLDNYTERDLTFWTADMNEDAMLNVGDFSILAAKILAGGAMSRAYALSPSYTTEASPISLQLAEQDGEWLLSIWLTDEQRAYNSMQFDLQLPSGLTLADRGIATTDRTRGFRSQVANQRIILYNLTDSNIKGSDGAVLTLKLNAIGQPNLTDAQVGLSNIILSDAADCSAIPVGDAIVAAMPDELSHVASATTHQDMAISTQRGQITIHATRDLTTTITTAAGQRLHTVSLGAGQSKTYAVPAGAYIVGNTKITVK